MKRFLVLLIIVSLSQSILAKDLHDIEKLVEDKIDIVIQLLKNQNISKQTRNRRIIEVTMPIIDFERMVKLSLGQKIWSRIDTRQKREFMAVFLKRLQESYLEKLDLYTDETVIMKASTQEGNYIRVVTELVTKMGNIEIVYKFMKSKNKWKAYDAEIFGISIVGIYRKQFFYFLKFHSFDDLIARLKTQSLGF